MPDNATQEDTLKTIQTVETSNDKISTKIGKQELTVNNYYGAYDISKKKRGSTLMGLLGKPIKEKWISVKPKKEYPISVLLPKIAFFLDLEGSGWAPDTFNGFKDAISKLKNENQKININDPFLWRYTT